MGKRAAKHTHINLGAQRNVIRLVVGVGNCCKEGNKSAHFRERFVIRTWPGMPADHVFFSAKEIAKTSDNFKDWMRKRIIVAFHFSFALSFASKRW